MVIFISLIFVLATYGEIRVLIGCLLCRHRHYFIHNTPEGE